MEVTGSIDEACHREDVMLPAIGYTIPVYAMDCLKDPAVDAVDFLLTKPSDATQLATISSQHPYGVLNIHLGSLSLTDDVAKWCSERSAIR